ncbi:MAG: hypothetical protein IT422_28810 [Pirellulaceae bacterium]|nr:hypothetical protein [Pirellulaceae bacterium]
MSDPTALVLEDESDGLRKQNGANTRGALRRYRDLVMGALFLILVVVYWSDGRCENEVCV